MKSTKKLANTVRPKDKNKKTIARHEQKILENI